MRSLLHPGPDGVGIELVEFIAVPYPRISRLLRDRRSELFGVGGDERGGSGRTEVGVALGQFRLGVDVETRVTEFSAYRLPIPSCSVSIECAPVRVGRYMRGMEAEMTVYPVTRASSVLWLEGIYRLAPGHSPDRLIVRRVVRACVEDLFDRVVQTIRTEAEASAPSRGSSARSRPAAGTLPDHAPATEQHAPGKRGVPIGA